MRIWKREIASLLAVIMLFSLIPTAAFAEMPEAAPFTVLSETVPKPLDTTAAEEMEAEEIGQDATAEEMEAGADAAAFDAEGEEAAAEETAVERESAVLASNTPTPTPTPAYEISYNVSGAGYWMVIGSDARQLEEDAHYALFESDGSYTIQMRETDRFPYVLEIRSRAGGDNTLWSAPEQVRFETATAGSDGKIVAGHRIRAMSKWLTQVQYSTASSPDHLEESYTPVWGYDSEGNYAISGTNVSFPLYVRFQYQLPGSSNWETVYFPNPERPEDAVPYAVFQNMDSTATVRGRVFSLKSDVQETAQYRVANQDGSLGSWVEVGSNKAHAFDINGNYTIDVGDRKDFPIRVYLRYQDADGWKYINGANSAGQSYYDYENVLDTTAIAGHVFSLHTDWMYDVQYALVSSGDINQNGPVFQVPSTGTDRWITVGVPSPRGNGRRSNISHYFDSAGNYAIDLDSLALNEKQMFSFQLVFKSIDPTGEWDSGANWEKNPEALNGTHLYTFYNVNSTADYEGHTFSVYTTHRNEVRYTLYTSYESATSYGRRYREVIVSSDAQELRSKHSGSPTALFSSDGSYTIVLTPPDNDRGLFPLYVKFRYMAEDGWHESEWNVPFNGRDYQAPDVDNRHNFFIRADFLDDVRFRRDGESQWTYLIPKTDAEAENPRPYYDARSDTKEIKPYESDGGYTIQLTDRDTFVRSGGEYFLNPGVQIEVWNPQDGWQNPTRPYVYRNFQSLNETRIVSTALGDENRHTFRLRAPLQDEVRYRLVYSDGTTTPGSGWIIVGSGGKEKFNSDGSFVIPLNMTTQRGNAPFPLKAYFQIYTEHTWVDPDITAGLASDGSGVFGTFADAEASVNVKNGDASHTFSVYYPWADSVTYTLTDRYYRSSGQLPENLQNRHTEVVGIVVQDEAYAEKHKSEGYFYAPSGGNVIIDLGEGDFFPINAVFTVRDKAGQVWTEMPAVMSGGVMSGGVLSGGEEIRPAIPIFQHKFTSNELDETYTVPKAPSYTFSAVSNWMNTIWVHLPNGAPDWDGISIPSDGSTFAVGDGTGPHMNESWRNANPNYRRFEKDGDIYRYTIDLRITDTFPLEVEFLKRSMEGDPRPVKVTFTSVDDHHDPFKDGHVFYLRSNYADTVRYILAYNDPDILSGGAAANGATSGVLNPSYQNRVVTVLSSGQKDWVDTHDPSHAHYGLFNSDGSFQIPLSESDALPVDVWFALPDENGSYANAIYHKWTITNRDDVVPPSPTPTPTQKPTPTQRPRPTTAPGQEATPTPTQAAATVPTETPTPTPTPPPPGPNHKFTVYAEWMDRVYYTLPKIPNRANLPNPQEIEVGTDAKRASEESEQAKAENREPLYVVYDSDGTYTIELEDDAFFPYVINVRYRLPQKKDPDVQYDSSGNRILVNDPYRGELVTVEGQIEFLTPDSTVEINGHTFKVHSRRTNPSAAVRINLVAGNHVIPLRLRGMSASPDETLAELEAKAARANLQSVQPLTEVQLWADLTGTFNLELANAHVEVFMPNLENQAEERVERFVWGEWNMDNYQSGEWDSGEESIAYRVIAPDTRLDLSAYSTTNPEGRIQYFEVIAGSTEQLNPNNIRYVIRTSMRYPSYDGLLKMKAAYQDDRRGGIYIFSSSYEHFDEDYEFPYQPPGLTTIGEDAYTFTSGGERKRVDVYRLKVSDTWRDGKLWMTLKPDKNAPHYAAFKDLEAEIYEGFFFSAEDAAAHGTRVPDSVWNQELDTQRIRDRYATYTDVINGPRGIEEGPKFTVIWKRNGDPVAIMPFRIIVDIDTSTIIVDSSGAYLGPVTFFAPHTYKDFILDENGNFETPIDLVQIGDPYYDSREDMMIANYWTDTAGNLYDDRYYVRARYNKNNGNWRNDNIKVYAGNVKYNTLSEAQAAARSEEASRAMDVTEQVFGNVGFGADYSSDYYSNGVVFSVFRSGTLIATQKIVTIRRQFLSFGTLQGPDYNQDSEMTIHHKSYDDEVIYILPDQAYRGEYRGEALLNIPVGYLRDFVPSSITDYGVRIVAGKGHYDTYNQAMASADTVDITDRLTERLDSSGRPVTNLFGETVQEINYRAAYRKGIYFSLYPSDGNGKVLDTRYVIAKEQERAANTYFEMLGANSTDGTPYNAYLMPANMDGYYDNGYQTLLLLKNDGSPVTDSEIVPVFAIDEDDGSGHQVRIYAGSDVDGGRAAGAPQESGKSVQSFFGDGEAHPIPYSAAASNQTHLKNYWVTFLTQQTGRGKLFINTANDADHLFSDGNGNAYPRRDVFITKSSGNYHDIFVTNIGDQPLTDVTVEFASGSSANLRVDDYWRIEGSGDATTIRPFTKTEMEAADIPGRNRYVDDPYHTDVQLPNVAKIRLYPKNPNSAGDIEDTLIIRARDAAGNVDEERLYLSGKIGNYFITTTAITGPEANAQATGAHDDYSKSAVRYVAFSRVIQTNWPYGENGVRFEVTEGRLPRGFGREEEPADNVPEWEADSGNEGIRPNGELFGVPLETGTFTFTVTATFSYPPGDYSDPDYQPLFTSTDSKTYTLEVLDHTQANVEDQISAEYNVLSWIPDMIIYSDGVIKTEEPLGDAGTNPKHRENVEPVELDGYQNIYLEFEAIEGNARGVEDFDWQVALYLNGKLLRPFDQDYPEQPYDYKKEHGSAAIIVEANTVRDQGVEGRNVLNAFGRERGNGESTNTSNASVTFNMDRAYGNGGSTPRPTKKPTSTPTKKPTTKPNNPTPTKKPSNGGGGGGGGGGSTWTPTNTPTPRPTSTPTPVPTYQITVAGMDFGWLQVNTERAARGTTIVITPHAEQNYEAKNIRVTTDNGLPVTVTLRADGTAAFVMPDRKVTVTATFEPIRLNGFTDISALDWFFEDAAWAYSYNGGLITGVTDTEWQPESLTTTLTPIIILTRLTKDLNLNDYEGETEEAAALRLADDDRFATAIVWASINGLIPRRPFVRETITRGDLALLLSNYLDYRSITVTLPEEPVAFADIDQIREMSAARREALGPNADSKYWDVEAALRKLHAAGVFQGDSAGSMLPYNSTKRSHLAALMHRMSTFIIDWETRHFS